MVSLAQLVGEVKIAVRHPVPLMCSRAELAVDKENAAIVLLLRTKPQLSEQILSARRHQYPLPLLMNHGAFFGKMARRAFEGAIAPAPSELTRAAFASVHLGAYHGTMVNLDSGRFIVPGVDSAMGMRGQEWAETLSTSEYPPFAENVEGALELYLIHLPDAPVQDLTSYDLWQVAMLAIGWNYALHLSEAEVRMMMQLIVETSEKAEVIAAY